MEGWVKLNCDVSVGGVDGQATIGGVLRVGGYSRFLGLCLIIEEKLWGMLEEPKVAWSLGLRRLEVEDDYATAITLVMVKRSGSSGLRLKT